MKSIFKTSNRNEKDFGFGKIASEEDRMRLINRDGSFNVERKELFFFTSLSLYHFLLDISWTKFFSLAAFGYILMNVFFTSVYMLIGNNAILGHDSSSFWELFANSFFFSVQTSSTIGFGHLLPGNLISNIVVSVESFLGILGVAVITGLLFARFSKPNAKIIFSENALIAPYKDGKLFMFRIVKARENQLFELDGEVNLILQKTIEGKSQRTFHKLDLEISHLTFFPLSWTVVHPIDSSSPLHNFSETDFINSDPEFYIFLKGVDDTFNQYVYTRSSYKMNEIAYGAKFESIFDIHKTGEKISIDISRLSRFERVTLP